LISATGVSVIALLRRAKPGLCHRFALLTDILIEVSAVTPHNFFLVALGIALVGLLADLYCILYDNAIIVAGY